MYTPRDLLRLHENVRRDGVYKRCLLFIVDFVLGAYTSLGFDTPRYYANEDRRKAALRSIQTNEQFLQVLDELSDIDARCEMNDRKREGLLLSLHYGRCNQVKQYDKELPQKIITLSPMRLSYHWVDIRDWTLLCVEYKDYPSEFNIIKAKDMIYYTNPDYHIAPNADIMDYLKVRISLPNQRLIAS